MTQEKKRIYHLYRRVLFPNCSITVKTGPGAAEEIHKGDIVLVLPIRTAFDILIPWRKTATLAEVTDIRTSDTMYTIVFRGISRVRIHNVERFKRGTYSAIEERGSEDAEHYVELLRKKSQELIFLINVEESDRLIHLLNYLSDLNQFADFIANYFVMNFQRRYALLRETDLTKRAEVLLKILEELIIKMKKKIQEKNEETGS